MRVKQARRVSSMRNVAQGGNEEPVEGLSLLAGQVHGSGHGGSTHAADEDNDKKRRTAPEQFARKGKEALFAILGGMRKQRMTSNKMWIIATAMSFIQVWW